MDNLEERLSELESTVEKIRSDAQERTDSLFQILLSVAASTNTHRIVDVVFSATEAYLMARLGFLRIDFRSVSLRREPSQCDLFVMAPSEGPDKYILRISYPTHSDPYRHKDYGFQSFQDLMEALADQLGG